MNSSDLKIVFLKELKEVLRDYRTLLMMIIIPTLFYPFFLIFPATLAQNTIEDMGKSSLKLGVVGDCDRLVQFLKNNKQFVVKEFPEDGLLSELNRKNIDVALVLPPDLNRLVSEENGITASELLTELKKATHPQIRVVFDSKRETVLFGISKLYRTLHEFEQLCVTQRFDALGIGGGWENKLTVDYKDIAPDGSKKSNILSQSVPYLMVLMILIATMYPALDLITGERQRGTLALLLVAPVSRRKIMYGKIGVVVLVGVVATMMGLISIFITVNYPPVKHFVEHANMKCDLSVASALGVAFMALPLTVLLSSMSMYVAAWTRTFQQGQGYFLPVVIVALLMSSAANLPDVSLDSIAAIVPIANTSLCMKEMLSDTFRWPWIALTLLSSGLYAWVLTRAATALLDREDLLFGVQQSPRAKKETGSYVRELVVFAGFLFMLLFYVGQLVTLWDPLAGNTVTQTLLILLPSLLFLRWHRLPVRETLALTPVPPRYLLGGLALSMATVFLAHLILTIQSNSLPYSEEYARQMKLLIIPPGRPLWIVLIVIAVLPAICEEVLFRGLVQGILKNRLSQNQLIVVIGILFGVFHLSLFRFLPTGTLGMVLAYLRIRTGSILPCMCLHMAHNGFYLWATVNDVEIMSTSMAALALIGLLIGLSSITADKSRRATQDTTTDGEQK